MPANEPLEERAGIPWEGLAITAAGIAVLALAVVLIDPLREAFDEAVSGDAEGLRERLREGAGVPLLLALILIHTFVWYPSEILDAAAGFVYDFWFALLLVQAGWVVQALIAYTIGRNAARPLLHRFIGRARFDRVERIINGGGATLLLAARLVPVVPFSLFSYVAGAARVPVGMFAWTTAIGYLPLTALFIYYGTQLQSLSLDDPIVWAGALLLLALVLLLRRLRPLIAATAEPPPERDSA